MYCSLTDLEHKVAPSVLIQLTDDAETGAIDMINLNAQILRASHDIDSHLRKIMPVPLTGTIPDLIKDACADIAVYYLHARKLDNIPSTRVWLYRNAVNLMKSIASGDTPYPAETEGGIEELEDTTIVSETREQVFRAETLDKF
jgi:phage gp36-like protein